MKATVEIIELKILKGPDRLLRLHVLFSDVFNFQNSIDMLAIIVESLIFKNHNLIIQFPTLKLLESIPENPKGIFKKYGEIFNGRLGVEMLFMYKSESIFKMRYYSEDLEFERNIISINRHVRLNDIDMDEYKAKFTLGDLRDGVDIPDITTKISYLKSK